VARGREEGVPHSRRTLSLEKKKQQRLSILLVWVQKEVRWHRDAGGKDNRNAIESEERSSFWALRFLRMRRKGRTKQRYPQESKEKKLKRTLSLFAKEREGGDMGRQ